MLKALIGAGVAASPLLSRAVADTGMAAAMFFDSYATIALRRALRYAGDDGFVASMPQLLHARVNAEYDNIIWNTWFTANSEENVVKTPQGNYVVVTVHGGGIFASRITAREAHEVLDGSLPDGSQIPVYPFDEFKQGIAELPMRYATVLDFKVAKNSARGYVSFDVLIDDPNMIVRAGGVELLAAYLDKARNRRNTKLMGNSHSHNWIDPDQPQSRILTLGGNKGGLGSEGNDQGLGWVYDADDGMGASWMGGLARYVAVAPRDVTTSLRDLDFEL
jgi:hypothetical protein